MPRFMALVLALALASCDGLSTTTSFRSVALDGFLQCSPPTPWYAQPLCVEYEGTGVEYGRVVLMGPRGADVDLPDRDGEWEFVVGLCEHARDPNATRYECGACRGTRRTSVALPAGARRRVALPMPTGGRCVER